MSASVTQAVADVRQRLHAALLGDALEREIILEVDRGADGNFFVRPREP